MKKAEFEKDRNEVFLSLDTDKFLAYCYKYQVPLPDISDKTLLAIMHKGRLSLPVINDEEKELSRKWLSENGCFEIR